MNEAIKKLQICKQIQHDSHSLCMIKYPQRGRYQSAVAEFLNSVNPLNLQWVKLGISNFTHRLTIASASSF